MRRFILLFSVHVQWLCSRWKGYVVIGRGQLSSHLDWLLFAWLLKARELYSTSHACWFVWAQLEHECRRVKVFTWTTAAVWPCRGTAAQPSCSASVGLEEQEAEGSLFAKCFTMVKHNPSDYSHFSFGLVSYQHSGGEGEEVSQHKEGALEKGTNGFLPATVSMGTCRLFVWCWSRCVCIAQCGYPFCPAQTVSSLQIWKLVSLVTLFSAGPWCDRAFGCYTKGVVTTFALTPVSVSINGFWAGMPCWSKPSAIWGWEALLLLMQQGSAPSWHFSEHLGKISVWLLKNSLHLKGLLQSPCCHPNSVMVWRLWISCYMPEWTSQGSELYFNQKS